MQYLLIFIATHRFSLFTAPSAAAAAAAEFQWWIRAEAD